MQRLQYRASVQGAPGIHILGAEEHRRLGGRSNKLEGPAVEINRPLPIPGPGSVKEEGFASVRERFSLEGAMTPPAPLASPFPLALV